MPAESLPGGTAGESPRHTLTANRSKKLLIPLILLRVALGLGHFVGP